jgi:hypothetical protein
MRKYFKAVESEKALDNWPLGFWGASGIDDKNYAVTTHYLKADEVPEVLTDSKTCSAFIAGLLNLYYRKENALELGEEQIMQMGILEEETDVAEKDPNQKEIPF